MTATSSFWPLLPYDPEMPSPGRPRSITHALGRFRDVERTVEELQQRVDDLENALAAVRDEFRRATESMAAGSSGAHPPDPER